VMLEDIAPCILAHDPIGLHAVRERYGVFEPRRLILILQTDNLDVSWEILERPKILTYLFHHSAAAQRTVAFLEVDL